MSLNLAHFLEMSAETYADRTAVILDDYRLSYADLNRLVKKVACILADKGVRKGDKVAMLMPNVPFFPVVYYGILSAGATVVPINVLLKAHEIQYCLEDADATVFFAWHGLLQESVKAYNAAETCHHFIVVDLPGATCEPPVGESLHALMAQAAPDFPLVETMPDDGAVILHTSGTTGLPKGAELTHFNMFFNAHHVKGEILRLTPEDIALAVLPLFHSFGQTCIMNACLMGGAAISMLPQFDTDKLMRTIMRDRITILAAVPTMYFYMLNVKKPESYDLSSLRMAVSGGAALPVDILLRFEKTYGVRILEGYGLTETSPVASFNVLDRPSKPGSIGIPIWGCEMKIMREDGSFAQNGEVGEIVIRGHNVMKGYYKKPVANQETIVNGWLHTGDLAYMDKDGYFFIVDRKKDIIIRAGMNIYPREIEEVLAAHPAVLEAAVIGIPDPARGEEVKAFLALREGVSFSVDELRAYCEERMARYKCPRYFEVLASLPKGPTGKILKKELRQRT